MPECVLDFLFNVLLVNLVGIGIAVGTVMEDEAGDFWEHITNLILTVIFWPIAIGMAIKGRRR